MSGMGSKLASARLVTHSGGSVIIASGKRPKPLSTILEGSEVGTLILAEGQTRAARLRWIGLTARPKGAIQVDDGARTALVNNGGSLLAIGVMGITGDFEKGDVVGIIVRIVVGGVGGASARTSRLVRRRSLRSPHTTLCVILVPPLGSARDPRGS